MKNYIFLLLVVFLIGACQTEEPNVVKELDSELKEAIKTVSKTGELDFYIFPESNDYENLPFQDPANPITEAKVKLGNLLFFETGLAQTPEKDCCYETYSCSSCHIPSKGFMPGRIQGVADGAFGYGGDGEYRVLAPGYESTDIDGQGTRPMNPFNAGYSTVTLWSGLFGAGGVNEGTEEYWTGIADVNHTGYVGLEAQNIEAFELHRLEINEKVLDEYGYRELYDEAFPEFEEEDRYSPTTSSFAISAFIRSFLANKAPFQNWLKGNEEALTDSQKEGALLFFGKANCSNCHNGTALSSMTFHALGTPDMYQLEGAMNTSEDDVRNFGRGMFTGKDEDMFRFKVPQLYNVGDYTHFFHGSSKQSLEEVVDFKIKASSENPHVDNSRLSSSFQALDLTPKEKANLIDFLKNGLYDADFERYVPESVLSGNCFPNNDPLSIQDLGCK